MSFAASTIPDSIFEGKLPDISFVDRGGPDVPAPFLTLPLRTATARLNLLLLLKQDLELRPRDVTLTSRDEWPVALVRGMCLTARPLAPGRWELARWPEAVAAPRGWSNFTAELSND